MYTQSLIRQHTHPGLPQQSGWLPTTTASRNSSLGGPCPARVPFTSCKSQRWTLSHKRDRFSAQLRRSGTPTQVSYTSDSAPRSQDEYVVGVDLGTTNSLVAKCGPSGLIEVIADTKGRFQMPSIVAYDGDGGIRVGHEAVTDLALPQDVSAANTFYAVKRLIGRTFEQAQSDIESLSYRVSCSTSGGKGGVLLDCPALGRSLLPEEISAEVLRGLWHRAHPTGAAPSKAVITVPPRFELVHRAATGVAVTLAGVPKHVTLYEPVAAALAYGLAQEEYCMLLVCDLGGGTFDVSVVEVGCGSMEVLGTAGDAYLGGHDFDLEIARWISVHLGDHLPEADDPELRSRISSLAVSAKERLTEQEEVEVDLSGLLPHGSSAPARATLTREMLEEACAPLLQRMIAPIEAAAAQAGVALHPSRRTPTEQYSSKWGSHPIDRLILVGGATRIPAVRRLMHDLTALEPLTAADVDPDHAVVIGAAMYAGMLEGAVEGVDFVEGSYTW